MNNPNFQDLHHTFRPRILRYMRRLVGEEEAEDLTQEVFLKVSQSLSDFKGKSRLSTWIYRIAANAAVDRLRMPSYKRVVREHPAKTRLVEIEGDCDRA
ncbi:MAG: sigma-70 family RNA polymerase sigma factor [Ignavibacteriales bacterium]|nr:sigma-70 family RNA polymerase sigma factor [Ignavibacteriales bacterium]